MNKDEKNSKICIIVYYYQIKKFDIENIPGLPKDWYWDGESIATDDFDKYLNSSDDYYGPTETEQLAKECIKKVYLELEKNGFLKDLRIE